MHERFNIQNLMSYFSSNDPMIINHRTDWVFFRCLQLMWDKITCYLDYMNCEILLIGDVNSPLDDLMILYASEVEFLSVLLFVYFSLAQSLKIISSRICVF